MTRPLATPQARPSSAPPRTRGTSAIDSSLARYEAWTPPAAAATPPPPSGEHPRSSARGRAAAFAARDGVARGRVAAPSIRLVRSRRVTTRRGLASRQRGVVARRRGRTASAPIARYVDGRATSRRAAWSASRARNTQWPYDGGEATDAHHRHVVGDFSNRSSAAVGGRRRRRRGVHRKLAVTPRTVDVVAVSSGGGAPLARGGKRRPRCGRAPRSKGRRAAAGGRSLRACSSMALAARPARSRGCCRRTRSSRPSTRLSSSTCVMTTASPGRGPHVHCARGAAPAALIRVAFARRPVRVRVEFRRARVRAARARALVALRLGPHDLLALADDARAAPTRSPGGQRGAWRRRRASSTTPTTPKGAAALSNEDDDDFVASLGAWPGGFEFELEIDEERGPARRPSARGRGRRALRARGLSGDFERVIVGAARAMRSRRRRPRLTRSTPRGRSSWISRRRTGSRTTRRAGARARRRRVRAAPTRAALCRALEFALIATAEPRVVSRSRAHCARRGVGRGRASVFSKPSCARARRRRGRRGREAAGGRRQPRQQVAAAAAADDVAADGAAARTAPQLRALTDRSPSRSMRRGPTTSSRRARRCARPRRPRRSPRLSRVAQPCAARRRRAIDRWFAPPARHTLARWVAVAGDGRGGLASGWGSTLDGGGDAGGGLARVFGFEPPDAPAGWRLAWRRRPRDVTARRAPRRTHLGVTIRVVATRILTSLRVRVVAYADELAAHVAQLDGATTPSGHLRRGG